MTGLLRNNFLGKIQDKKYYFCVYSVLFVCLSLVVYSSFLLFGKSFVWYNDGQAQHYPVLAYFGWWCREFLKNIFEGSFSLPLWDFSIGYGGDVITTFHYYGLGDPLSLLSVFVPTGYSEYLYGFLVLLRLYLAGWFFVLFCKRMKQDIRISLLGAFLYIFSGYVLYAGVRHPFFLTPMIYLPLILIGTEKILSKENPALFIVSVALATLSNFYFSFMLIIFTVIYVIVRYFTLQHEKEWKKFFILLVKFAGLGLIAILISCAILLPIIMVYLNSSRATATAIPFIYPLSYYEKLFAAFLGNTNLGYWNITGYSPLSLISVFYIFSKKNRYNTLKIFFAILLVLQLFPVFGYLICGMVYVSNRWIWAFSFLMSFISVYAFKDIIKSDVKEKKKLVIFSAIYALLSLFLLGNESASSLASLVLFLLILGVLLAYNFIFENNKKVYCSIAVSVLCCISIILNACFLYYPIFGNNFLYEFVNSSEVLKNNDSSSASIYKNEIVEDAQMNRYDYNKIVFGNNNQALLTHTNSISYYWSFSEATIPSFLNEMEVNNMWTYLYTDLNQRTFLNSLASVKYYIESNSGHKPYKYNYIKTKKSNGEKYRLYENEYALPVGYTYDKYISRDEYEKLSSLEKQEALMQNVLLETDVSGYNKNSYTITNSEIPYSVSYGNGVVSTDEGVYITQANSSIKLEFDGLKNSETYIRFTDLNVEYLDDYELHKAIPEIYAGKDNEINRKIRAYKHLYNTGVSSFKINLYNGITNSSFTLTTPNNSFHNGKKNFTVNLGYSKDKMNYCNISFPSTGFYSWESMQVICQPMENYQNYVSKLSENVLQNVTVADNVVSGKIDLSEPKILCLSIPYSKGWTAYVDGVETELLRANTWCMAIDLKAGKHSIELRYKTPGLFVGIAASGVGLILLGAVVLLYKRKPFANRI